jgi:hypothetical protein
MSTGRGEHPVVHRLGDPEPSSSVVVEKLSDPDAQWCGG